MLVSGAMVDINRDIIPNADSRQGPEAMSLAISNMYKVKGALHKIFNLPCKTVVTP